MIIIYFYLQDFRFWCIIISDYDIILFTRIIIFGVFLCVFFY